MKKLLAILLFAMTITQMQAAMVQIGKIENETDDL